MRFWGEQGVVRLEEDAVEDAVRTHPLHNPLSFWVLTFAVFLQNAVEPDNGAIALAVVTETRMVAMAFPAVRSEPTVAKVEDAVKRGESSLWMFEAKGWCD
jgi:hypothetical protein